MPDNGHHYIALTVLAFSDNIYEWFGRVHDCYILHSSFLDTQFRNFKNTNPFPVFFERDEEDEDSTGKTLSNTSVEQTTGPNILAFWEDKSFSTPE